MIIVDIARHNPRHGGGCDQLDDFDVIGDYRGGGLVDGVGSFLLPKVTVETPTISREFLIRRV